jgi:hypothetical protein
MSIYNGANVGNFGTNPEDLEDINDAARYADISRKWAVSEVPVDDGTNPIDESSRTWAEIAKEIVSEIEELETTAYNVEPGGDATAEYVKPLITFGIPEGIQGADGEATIAYVDAGDAATLVSAGEYSDLADAAVLVDAKAYADTGDASLQVQIDSIASGISLRGTATVAELNALTGVSVNYAWKLLDSGTLIAGSVAVVTDDTVIWDGLVWINLGQSDTGIEEAPINGLQHARKDASWEVVDAYAQSYIDTSQGVQDDRLTLLEGGLLTINTISEDVFTDVAGQTEFTATVAGSTYEVLFNAGMLLEGLDFTVAGMVITLTDPVPTAGDYVRLRSTDLVASDGYVDLTGEQVINGKKIFNNFQQPSDVSHNIGNPTGDGITYKTVFDSVSGQYRFGKYSDSVFVTNIYIVDPVSGILSAVPQGVSAEALVRKDYVDSGYSIHDAAITLNTAKKGTETTHVLSGTVLTITY